jgi:adenylate cyclase
MTETRKLAAILVADVVGYSRLAGADEDRTLSRLRGLRSDLIDPAITAHHGRIVKRTGDGIIIEFRSVVDAVRCAIEVQNGMVERNAGLPPEKRIEFRVGIHVGDVVEENDGDLMGEGVNIAARLEGIAKPGAICLSEQAYWQVKGRLDLKVSDLGATRLKNIAEPVHVYSLEVGVPNAKSKPAAAARGWFAPAAAALAVLLVIAGAPAWYLKAVKPAATVASSSESSHAAPFGVPTVAVLPFANVTGDPQYETLTQRIGQKTRDAASGSTIWRIVGRTGGAAGSTGDPIEAGRQLNADYVVAGNLEAGGDALRVTFQLNDVHSGARLWSQTISPVLEKPNTAAAEAEVAGHAKWLLTDAIISAEYARLSSTGDIEKTSWGCAVQGWSIFSRPETTARARQCLEAAAQREPSNPNVWRALAVVLRSQRTWGWGLPPEEANVEKRAHLADQALQTALRARDLAPFDAFAQFEVAMGYQATCDADRIRVEAEKAVGLDPYDPGVLGVMGEIVAFSGHQWDEGVALAERALKLAGPSAEPDWWWPTAKRAWLRGEYQEAYEAFQHGYFESFWLSHLDLAYTLPFLGRIDEAKQHVSALLKIYPTMTIREADAFYKLVCFEPAFREKMVGALRQAGLPE